MLKGNLPYHDQQGLPCSRWRVAHWIFLTVLLLFLGLHFGGFTIHAQTLTPTLKPGAPSQNPPTEAADAPELPEASSENLGNSSAAIRIGFWQGLVSNLLPLEEQYRAELQKLEKEYVAKNDWQAALATQKAIKESENRIASLNAKHESENLKSINSNIGTTKSSDALTLKPSLATLSGGVTYNSQTQALEGWTNEGASATWKLPPISPGGYEIHIKYTHLGEKNGTFRISEEFYYLDDIPEMDFNPLQTHKNVGTLRVKEGKELKITLLSSPASPPSRTSLGIQSIEIIPSHP